MSDEHPSLREFVERIIEERDRLYDARIKALGNYIHDYSGTENKGER